MLQSSTFTYRKTTTQTSGPVQDTCVYKPFIRKVVILMAVTPIPRWVFPFLFQICKDENRSTRECPDVVWKTTDKKYSSGCYMDRANLIKINTGQDTTDLTQTFLHEVCNWLVKPRNWKASRRRVWHGRRFYTKLNELLHRYGCFTEENRRRENRYMKTSVHLLKGGDDS